MIAERDSVDELEPMISDLAEKIPGNRKRR